MLQNSEKCLLDIDRAQGYTFKSGWFVQTRVQNTKGI